MDINPYPFMAMAACIACYLAGVQVGRYVARNPGPTRQWCVFDTDAPADNQTIVTARSPDEALAIAGRQVFGLQVEEAE